MAKDWRDVERGTRFERGRELVVNGVDDGGAVVGDWQNPVALQERLASLPQTGLGQDAGRGVRRARVRARVGALGRRVPAPARVRAVHLRRSVLCVRCRPCLKTAFRILERTLKGWMVGAVMATAASIAASARFFG